MLKFLKSYRLYFGAVIAVLLWQAVCVWQRWEADFGPVWWLLLLLPVLAVAGMWLCWRRGWALLPPVWVLWGLSALAPLYALCNIDAYRYGGLLMPVSMFLAAGIMCLLWALLRYGALVLWLPFLFFQIVQFASYEQYGTRINSLVLAETMEASRDELATYITGNNLLMLIGVVLAICLLGAAQALLLRKQRFMSLLNAGFVFCFAAALLASVAPEDKRVRDTWWPVFPAGDLWMAMYEAFYHNQATVACVEGLSSPAEKPTGISTLTGGEGVVLILHVGESVRADRVSFNGYERDTTPWLRRQSGIISFTDCISAAHDTCQAQIAILTDARRNISGKEPGMQPNTGSVLDLFKANGFKVYSFFGRLAAQQLKYDRVVRLLTRCSEARFNAPGSPWTSVPQMSEVLRSVGREENLVFFINNEGSHTPFEHYDRENPPFAPAVHRFENPSAQAEGVNNAYDNTVHYTDEFVRRVCHELQGRPFVYVYVSDHGEYLGHDGMWGRAALGEGKVRYHDTSGSRVAMFVLCSPGFEEVHPHFAASLAKLREHADMTVGHEHIFHTVLGMFGISSPYYKPELDLSSEKAQPYSGRKPAPVP